MSLHHLNDADHTQHRIIGPWESEDSTTAPSLSNLSLVPEDRTHGSELLLDEDLTVHAGTLPAVVAHLTSHHYPRMSIHP